MNSTAEKTEEATSIGQPDKKIVVHTPQRKAKRSDKERVRYSDAKRIALKDTNCSSTKEVKKKLQQHGITLDLRMTSAWVAIKDELQWLLNGVPVPGANILESDKSYNKQDTKNKPFVIPHIPYITAPVPFANDIDAMNWYMNNCAINRSSVGTITESF